jgi:hypothetical protein
VTFAGFVAIAVAALPAPGYGPEARLTVSYTAEAGYAAAVKLECDPVGGGHPQAVRVCAELDAVAGDPERLPLGTGACVALYAPVEAELTGTWHGTTIAWRQRYGNSCEMRRATGGLFDF